MTSRIEPGGDDERWASVAGRDSGADGAFVYAVRTTGVYCRPACRSRRPNRANVAFFDDAEAAERAGFRACRRCEPAAGRRVDRHRPDGRPGLPDDRGGPSGRPSPDWPPRRA